MRNKIWYKLLDVKLGEEYLKLYLDLQKSISNCVKIVTLLLSLSGIFKWKFFENYVFFVLAIIAMIQIFSLIQSHLIRTEKDIEEIAALRVLYSTNLTKMEKLWLQCQNDRLDENELEKAYFEFVQLERSEVLTIDDKLGIKDFKRLTKRAEKETMIYMNKYNT